MTKETDPMDKYSQPIGEKETNLARIFYLDPRENPEKPGRSLRVFFDDRFPLVEGFKPSYLYTVTFEKEGSQAGNHYHQVKSELFYPVAGKFEVYLENPENKESEMIPLNTENHTVLYIKAGVAHKVVSKSEKSVLMVAATAPNIDGDEFPYNVSS